MKLISTEAFRSYVGHRKMTIEEVAYRAGVSKALVGHLHSGKRNSCRDDNAARIERALDAPEGSLFLREVSTVTRDVGRRRVASKVGAA
ncbi:transcriptional regulator with XRE-family HTH domain [Brevibacterium pityocampae]